jgi:hypothetical protein
MTSNALTETPGSYMPEERNGSGRVPSSMELLERATESTCLSDFGNDSFREGLEVFLDSLERDARLTPEGVSALAGVLQRRLENRLAIENWYRTHPEVEDQQVAPPVCITGLPRTGTSALATLLSLETSFRPMRMWEIERSAPPPVLEEEHIDPRRLAMLADFRRMQESHPDLAAMHLWDIGGTAEDVEVLGLEFRAQTCTAPAFSYHAWWRDSDMRQAYAYHRRVCKLLQSRRGPNRWLLKAPHYAFHIDAILAAYPGARFIVTHRDPVKAIPSWSSLITSLYPPGWQAHFRPADIGVRLAEHQAIGMQRLIEARERLGGHQFLDIHHREFAADPLGVVERIYEFLGMEFSGALRAEMVSWTEKNAMGTRGAHRYTLEEFGLSASQLRSDFAFYTDYFDVPVDV